MSQNVSLPLLIGFHLCDFNPIFQNEVEFSLQPGINIILGGNGLGKTTIMQAIVYALTGGLSENIEKQKSLRWNDKYFRERLKRKTLSNSYVEVSFAFGEHKYSVRRGFNNNEVVAFHNSKGGWVEDVSLARKLYAEVLEGAGYKDSEEFSRLVNRLLYLPETRQSLAWDFDAQLRLMTLLNQSFAKQADIQKRREELVKLDSDSRHLSWGIKRLSDRITQIKEEESESENEEISVTNNEISETDNLKQLIEELEEVTGQRQKLEESKRKIAQKLTSSSNDLTTLRTEIENAEGALIAESLAHQEKRNVLALEKITSIGICPACGTKQNSLKEAAEQYAQEHKCVLCGSNEPVLESPELSTLRSRLNEKLRSQEFFQAEFREIETRLDLIRRNEADLQFRVNEIRSKQSLLPLIERGNIPVGESLPDLEKQLEQFERDAFNLSSQLIERKAELLKYYEDFRKLVNEEITNLREIYQRYATQFLGIKCELKEIAYNEKGVRFTTFVPEFNGIERKNSDSCSEAQRFFLDIAFRMALIELTAQRRNEKATFICETPESALDVSYVDNVVKMFQQFVEKGHTLILTANIQEIGLAEKLLKNQSSSQKKKRVLNLLKIGQLSEVHQENLSHLEKLVQKIFK